ncbi:MAG: Smr/MutS family protein [Erysipelotrichaceae bacterium]|nr:Smr/MutS family protein [Erysipelotrichaceae bacterium]
MSAMPMNKYNNLDLGVIRQQITEYASISEAKEYILNEDVIFNPLQIRKNALESKEAMDLLRKDLIVSFDGVYNVNELLERTQKRIRLSGVDLKNVLVFHNHCQRIKKIFDKLSDELSIRDYTDSINLKQSVFDEISDCIDNSGEVKDDASDRLKQINNDLERCEKDLYNRAYNFINKHTDSLQEASIYLRNDRITFLIKNSDKNKYQGYTYGSSSSGLAFYVEPASFIDANNRKVSLMQDREDEIERILTRLSYLVTSIAEDYAGNFECLMKLCVIFAKANYGLRRGGIIAELSDDLNFDFKDLAHPLIDPKKVVSNSYRLFDPYLGIVISGSNTGGKTVSLKAIGLSILMTYLGIPIIASEARVPLYRNIYVDIDDNQSIADSLSTFSAHIRNINDILSDADERCLILIDELISGTDPKEAQAISLAILDRIKEIEARFIITTHFDDIKNYSYEDERILLSSVGFDMNTLNPTYKYLEDSVGASNALEIASRYFDDPEIIENARRYLEKNKSAQDELMDRLARQIEETELIKEELSEERIKAQNKEKEYNEMIAAFEKEKDELKQKYLKQLDEYIEEVKEQAQEKLESIKEVKNTQVIEQIEELKSDETVKTEEEKHVFEVGDNVRIKDNEQVGVISAINKDQATVNVRGLTIKVKISDLILMPKIKKAQTKVTAKKYSRVPSEINLVGQRVEDGLVMMEEYLDKANASHMSNVKVIHGIGTGILRKALRQRLSRLSYVKSFKDGDYYDGGSAVTIVEFK